MPRIRNLTAISTLLLALGPTSGCIDLSGWDEMANLSSAGDTAISLSEDGTIIMHVIACKAPLQEINVSIRGDYPEAPRKKETVRLDSPQCQVRVFGRGVPGSWSGWCSGLLVGLPAPALHGRAGVWG
ncbi:hypothetical protein [Corynebacterium lizhenjunii]|uniref:hypothetical protein n=1 Tax=Corynebacterium lizhenjunii TaxID=2709394 RepID=UPI0013EC7913|nr:hypothetical protein [Corynebacterium lizhenjunii]